MICLKCIVVVFSNFQQYLLNVGRKMFYDIIIYLQNQEAKIEMEYDEILQNIKMRDKNDMEKEIGALKKAPDAVYIDSSNLSITQVKDKIIEIIKEKK